MLDKKARIKLIFAVVDKLIEPGLSWQRVNVILETYGLEPYSTSSPTTLSEIVSAASDDVLVELAQFLELDIPDVHVPHSHVATVTSSRPLFIFGSHLTVHKVLVGDVSHALALYGIQLFVAHDSIDHDTLWQAEIEKALDHSDAGLVFLHQHLNESPWCDQEIGWLQGRHVPVMAFRFDLTPYGFFAKHQAQQVPQGATAQTIADMALERIAKHPDLADGFAASLVSAMAASNTFAQTNSIWKYLRELTSLDSNLCSQLLEATKSNNQIYWAYSRLDSRQSFDRVIVDFLRRQPGGTVIASDIDAYETYLNEQDAEFEAEKQQTHERLKAKLEDPFEPQAF